MSFNDWLRGLFPNRSCCCGKRRQRRQRAKTSRPLTVEQLEDWTLPNLLIPVPLRVDPGLTSGAADRLPVGLEDGGNAHRDASARSTFARAGALALASLDGSMDRFVSSADPAVARTTAV